MKKKTTKKKRIKKQQFTLWNNNYEYGIDAESPQELLEHAMNTACEEDGPMYFSMLYNGFLFKSIIVVNGQMSWTNHVDILK